MATITIKHRDGTTTGPVEMTKPITVTASAGILLQPSPESLAVACSRDPGGVELFYQRNYNAIVNHENTLDSEGDPEFTFAYTDGYYVSRVNGVLGLGGAFHIVGGNTFRWSPATNGIAIDDIGRPDVDCSDYLTIAGYLETLKNALDSIRGQIGDAPVAGPGSTATTFGMHKQYQSVVHLWNYLVYRMAVLFEVSFQSNAFYLQGTFINTADVAVALRPCRLTLSLPMDVPEGSTACRFSTIQSNSSSEVNPAWTSSDPPEVSIAGGGECTWDIESTASVYPRQQVVFTVRVDIKIPKDSVLPAGTAVASLSWPVIIYELNNTPTPITIEKTRSLFVWQEDAPEEEEEPAP